MRETMSDPIVPDEPFEDPDSDETENPITHRDGAGVSPPNTPWSAPPGGWEQPGPANVGWGPPPPEAGSSPLPLPDAGSLPPHLSPDTAPRRRHRFAAIALSALLLGGAVLVGVAVSRDFWRSPAATAALTHRAGGASAIASAVDPALVDINLTLGYGSGEGAATGIVLTASGLVLTNNHVVDGATAIQATDLGNGRSYSATVLGYDTSKDVALIQLRGASGLATAQLGDSSAVTVGQAVVGIGNAGGLGGTPSAAAGAVVALDQQITAGDVLDGSSEQLAGLIETNADIRPGDSGGPLLNAAGQVIAMDTAASGGFSLNSTAHHNQSFAIPINTARAVVSQIENHDASATVHIGPTAFLGVELQPAAQGSLSGGSGSASSGATIDGVVPGTPAAHAGLTAGDTIVSVGGQPVASPTALTVLLTRHQPGDKVAIGWSDTSGGQHTSTVTLAAGPAH